MFDALYKGKKYRLQYKQLLNESSPNPMAIFDKDYSQAYYYNNAFMSSLEFSTSTKVKAFLTDFEIEEEIIYRSKPLFTELGLINKKSPTLVAEKAKLGNETVNFQKITLNDFMNALHKNYAILKDLEAITISVIADLANTDKEDLDSLKADFDLKRNEEIKVFSSRETDFCSKRREEEYGYVDSFDRENPWDRPRVFKVKIFPFIWEEYESIGMIMEDLTDKKTIMDLKVADRNQDLLIAIVSHEMRTPLNGMLGLIDIAKKNAQDLGTLTYLNACKNSGLLLLNLVNSILDLNQVKNQKLRLNFSKVNVSAMLSEIKPLFDYVSNLKQLSLDVKIRSNVPANIYTDRNRLSQILINLLGNAFKFTFSGGVIIQVELENNDKNK